MTDSAATYVERMRENLREFEALSHEERRQRLAELHSRLPSHLYHYRGFDGPNDERNLRDMLVKSQLFLRAPSDFNDPFECRFQFGTLGTMAEVHAYLVHAAVAQGATPAVVASLADGMARLGAAGIQQAATEDSHRRLQAVGICCFAESYKNTLMWSHYGQSHKGVCIEFDVAHGVSLFGLCNKVEYGGPLPKLDYPSTDPRDVIAPIFRKSKHWEYEEEWRVAIPSWSHRHLDFPAEAVTAVVFGCAAGDQARAVVNGLLEERASLGLPPVRQKRVVRAIHDYLLEDAPDGT